MTHPLVGRIAGGAAIAALAAGGFVLTHAPQADALSADCSAWIREGDGQYQGLGQCNSVGEDTKVHVTLDIPHHPDLHSEWFHDINTVHSTSWTSTEPRAARTDLQVR